MRSFCALVLPVRSSAPRVRAPPREIMAVCCRYAAVALFTDGEAEIAHQVGLWFEKLT